jgi:hypothetical protein
MMVAVIDPVTMKVSVAAMDLHTARLDPDMESGFPYL